MATFTVGTGTDYALEEGMYPCELIAIEDAIRDPNQPSKFGDKPQFIFTYQLLSEDGEALAWDDNTPATKREWINKVQALTPKSTLYARFSALCNEGQPLDPATEYDTNDLLHKRGQMFWGAYVGEDGSRKFKIQSVSASPKKRPVAGLRRKIADDEPIDPEQPLDTDKL